MSKVLLLACIHNSELTLDRIIMGAGRKKFCMTSGYINYQDFVCGDWKCVLIASFADCGRKQTISNINSILVPNPRFAGIRSN